jgi:membrane protein
VIVFRLTLSSTIVSDYRKYGSIGVVFAIMSLLIAIGVVIMLGALLGVMWRERYDRRPRDEPEEQLGGSRVATALFV